MIEARPCPCGSPAAYGRKSCNSCRGKAQRARNPEATRAYNAQYKTEHRERLAKQFRAYNVKRYYGTTLENADQVLASQKACAICAVPLTEFGRRSHQAVIDHCHEQGTFRGVLCSLCNKGLGCFRDRPELLDAAKSYLQRSRVRAA